ncbi:hypothetical protein MKZ38_007557 [Zalerion maritima]|uniref:Uncharacterized protein n=1 Tax=Zalerion maritima TaxID=339359 RepID=A0AAD5RIB8_9PEZI|nr:hypothetical protein MKZ38_007557 [Zalerion maritima]
MLALSMLALTLAAFALAAPVADVGAHDLTKKRDLQKKKYTGAGGVSIIDYGDEEATPEKKRYNGAGSIGILNDEGKEEETV